MPTSRGLLYGNGQENSAGNYSSDGNNSIDCLANCIGFCNAGGCFPSPPSSPDNGNSGNVTTPINLHNRFGALPTLTITAICSIVVSFLILMCMYIYLRFRRRGRRNLPQAPAAADVAVDDDEDVRPGGEIEHHIWYIRTQGLDENTITSIAAWIYKSGDGVIDGRDCPVCLGEFHDGELVRLLPKCSHAFHLLCIDRWLRSHVNCPLCRAPILSQPPDSSPALDFATDSPETEIRSSDSIENPQVEAPTLPSNDDEFEFRIGIHPAEEPSSHHASSDLQPIRRSISMDSLSVDILIREEMGERTFAVDEDGRSSPNRKKRRKIRLKAHTSMLC